VAAEDLLDLAVLLGRPLGEELPDPLATRGHQPVVDLASRGSRGIEGGSIDTSARAAPVRLLMPAPAAKKGRRRG
jgi:hypothetical protein